MSDGADRGGGRPGDDPSAHPPAMQDEARQEAAGAQDFSPRVTPTYLVGVYLAINAIPDAALMVDGPACFPLKTPSIQGNHDLFSTLTNVVGKDRCVTTELSPSTVVFPREPRYAELLSALEAREDVGGVVLCARPMAAITGTDYERIQRLARERMRKPLFLAPPLSLSGDWLTGYAAVLASLADALDLSAAAPHEGAVAVVGYLHDRGEGDHEGNHAELARLLGGLGLSIASTWLSGTTFEELARAGEASAVVSLPYGRKAARRLAQRLGVPLVETCLPLGFGATERFLRDVGGALGAAERAEALIERELGRFAPRLEWIIPFVLQHERWGFLGDPHHLPGLRDLLGMMGSELAFACLTASATHVQDRAWLAGIPEVRAEPRRAWLEPFLETQVRDEGVALLFASSVEARMPSVPIVQLGYPSFATHRLLPRPFLGFAGAVGLAEDASNALRAGRPRRPRRA